MVFIEIPDESIGSPFPLTHSSYKIVSIDAVAIELNPIVPDHWIMTIYSHAGVVVRDGEHENFPTQFPLTLHVFEESDDPSQRDAHALSVLTISKVESRIATLDFACEKGEVYPRRSFETCNKFQSELINERFELVHL